MIEPAYVRTMAAYNAEMNHRLYEASSRISDEERRADRGAFWGSLHGTLTHLYWGDSMWLSRFADWPRPDVPIKESAHMIEDFTTLAAAREELDGAISDWAAMVDENWLAGELTWFSGGADREVTAPRRLLVVHMFNHQTHHRGQAHALITRAGEKTGDTDLFLVIPGIA
ncbi:MAG TPA: DinB family protein [Acetobacteraceae bacterium]|nr:DinB family protein [Acetobacteraceae bacterium]